MSKQSLQLHTLGDFSGVVSEPTVNQPQKYCLSAEEIRNSFYLFSYHSWENGKMSKIGAGMRAWAPLAMEHHVSS
jgi:hypothetical protein